MSAGGSPHISDPIGFIPTERCSWNHRFDDSKRRFRTLYCAIRPETALREVLADLRRNIDEIGLSQIGGAPADARAPFSSAVFLLKHWRSGRAPGPPTNRSSAAISWERQCCPTSR
jgi:hypothetical protein